MLDNPNMPPINDTQSVQQSLSAVGAVQSPVPAPTVVKPAPLTQSQAKMQQFNQNQTQQAQKTPASPSTPKPLQKPSPTQNGNDLQPSDSSGNVQTAADRFMSSITVTKGLLAAFAGLVLLIWLLMPTASGYTRAQLLWFTLIGQAKINTNFAGIDNTAATDQPTPTSNPIVQAQGPSPEQLNQNNHATNNVIDLSALDRLF